MSTFPCVDVSGRNRPGSDKPHLDFPTKSDTDMTVTHWDVPSKVTHGTTGRKHLSRSRNPSYVLKGEASLEALGKESKEETSVLVK